MTFELIDHAFHNCYHIMKYELIIKALESKCYADVIYLNFAKGLDKVDQGILLQKLHKMNVSGELPLSIHNFL